MVNQFSMVLAAADGDGFAKTQALEAAGSLTLNGDLGGECDIARRVIITSAGDDSAVTWTVTGTDRNGNAQSEDLTGANAVAVSTIKDYLTVTDISADAAAAGNVTAGTNSVASSAPIAIDYYSGAPQYTAAMTFAGTANVTLEVTNDDPGDAYDFDGNTPTWFAANGFEALTTDTLGVIPAPLTMVRLTINSGTDAVTLKFNS